VSGVQILAGHRAALSPEFRAPTRARRVADEMPVPQRRQVWVGRHEPARAWLLHASSGSPGVDAVVTALVHAASRRSVSTPSHDRTDPPATERQGLIESAIHFRLTEHGRAQLPDDYEPPLRYGSGIPWEVRS
jgi:hypothetical protein